MSPLYRVRCSMACCTVSSVNPERHAVETIMAQDKTTFSILAASIPFAQVKDREFVLLKLGCISADGSSESGHDPHSYFLEWNGPDANTAAHTRHRSRIKRKNLHFLTEESKRVYSLAPDYVDARATASRAFGCHPLNCATHALCSVSKSLHSMLRGKSDCHLRVERCSRLSAFVWSKQESRAQALRVLNEQLALNKSQWSRRTYASRVVVFGGMVKALLGQKVPFVLQEKARLVLASP